jgi:hypothetical protein
MQEKELLKLQRLKLNKKKTKKLNKMRSKKEIIEKIKELEEEVSDKKKLDIEKINIAGMLRALRWVIEEEK